MDIYQAINAAMENPPNNRDDATALLSHYSPDVQAQLVTAVYLGKNLLNQSKIPAGEDLSRTVSEREEFPDILAKHSHVMVQYLGKLKECAANSNYDLRKL